MNTYLLGKVVKVPITVEVTEKDGSLSRHTKRKGDRIDSAYIGKIYDSASIPFAFPTHGGFDSGLQNPVPLSAAIDNAHEGDFICIISCHPVKRYKIEEPTSEIDKLAFTLEVMQSALVRASVDPFLRLNQNEGPWKHFFSQVIAPEKPLPWGMLDFTNSKTDYLKYTNP
jgi:hypothetical protein